MKILRNIFLFIVIFFVVERFCRSQTAGFRPGKTISDHCFEEKWDVAFSPDEEEQARQILSQPYYFLGSGVQCYAFLSEDKQTVLKIFKPYHLWPPTHILSSLPLPLSFRKRTIAAREKRLSSIFESAKIAVIDLAEETGVFYLHLNTTEHEFPCITLYDKLGISHQIPLDQTAFALQKKAELAFDHFTKENGKETVNQLFALVVQRCKKGIENSDAALYKNVGFVANKAILIDIGSFSKNPFLKKAYMLKKEVLSETRELKEYLKRHYPELLNDYYENVAKVLETPST